MYVAQAEWRTQVTARWGATAFVGIGQVGPDFGSLEDRLPAAGVGVRFLVAPEHRVNLSADLAWNKDGETSFYLRIGEAF
jgi:outer membrane translocation and assembly module TamA